MPVFFHEAIRFCLDAWVKQLAEADPRSTTRRRIHTQMLVLFKQGVRMISFL
jgi:hypothetical protein